MATLARNNIFIRFICRQLSWDYNSHCFREYRDASAPLENPIVGSYSCPPIFPSCLGVHTTYTSRSGILLAFMTCRSSALYDSNVSAGTFDRSLILRGLVVDARRFADEPCRHFTSSFTIYMIFHSATLTIYDIRDCVCVCVFYMYF